MNDPKPLAKSLHTLSVLVAVAKREREYGAQNNLIALTRALRVLGYEDLARTVADGKPRGLDPHGIVVKALHLLA